MTPLALPVEMDVELRKQAWRVRRRLLEMHFSAQSGHLGTGLSAVDLLTYVFRSWLRPDPSAGRGWPYRDRFILSKGHGASSLYATLHEAGILSAEEMRTYYCDGTSLPAHPAARAFPAIPIATGSLGHGLSVAAGMAYAARHLLDSGSRIACLLSDGECNEGSVWEAAMFAAHHRLDNLLVLVDANGLQGFGRTKDVLNLEPFASKWEAFGFTATEAEGHDFSSIALACSQATSGRPHCVVARTVKGKGVTFMEDRLEWHYLPVSEPQYRQALAELERNAP